MILRIVTVDTGQEVGRVEVADDTVSYSDDTIAAIVRTFRRDHSDLGEAEAIAALQREGWSNGYLMVALDAAE